MTLDERKLEILRAIIDDYIDTAEPIGSRTLAKKPELGLSSATIRNEMADLEDMGYLEQPHTSAGRVPSDKGYRIYVDRLMKTKQLDMEDMKAVTKALDLKINELGQLIKQASAIMSRVTKYTSMAMTPQMDKSTLRAIQVVPIENGKALVVVVTNTGVVKNTIIRISEQIAPDVVIKISNIVNDRLSGLTIEKINLPVIRELEYLIGLSTDIVLPILNGIAECIGQVDDSEVFTDGSKNILNYPEFKNAGKAKEFLDTMEEKGIIQKILRSAALEEGCEVRIQIGRENNMLEIKDCTLITTTYSLGNKVIGSIGIIGPTRMEYSRVISSMNYIKKKMNEELFKIVGANLDGS